MDAKDILGAARASGPAAPPPAAAKPKERKPVKPKGMSREAFALLQGGGSHPLTSSVAAKVVGASAAGSAEVGPAGLGGISPAAALAAGRALAGVAKRRPGREARTAWRWLPFENEARSDDLRLFHWTKCRLDASGQAHPEEAGPYRYSKYGKPPSVPHPDDEEWENLLEPSADWSKEETEYLLDLAKELELRWPVISDRYSWPAAPGSGDGAARAGGVSDAASGSAGGGAGGSTAGKSGGGGGSSSGEGDRPGVTTCPRRTLEALKGRYYELARRLLIGRRGGREAVANDPLVRRPYDVETERERRRGLELLMSRPRGKDAEEDAILAKAQAVEARRAEEESARRKVEGDGAAAAAAVGGATGSTGAADGPSGRAGPGGAGTPAAGVVGPSAGGGASRGQSPSPGGPQGQRAPAPPRQIEAIPATPALGQPPLFAVGGAPTLPPPGVHTVALGLHAREALAAAKAKLQPAKLQRAFEASLSDLRLEAFPTAVTRPTVGAYMALAGEILQLLDLKRQLAARVPLSAGAKRSARRDDDDDGGGKRRRGGADY